QCAFVAAEPLPFLPAVA
ncbi:MFS transporter, partial [Streptomyces variabilis]